MFPQETSISGTVIDFNTKEAIPYATITCKNSLGSIINGIISNEDGSFLITKLPLEKTIIEIQFIGYKTIIRKVEFTKDNFKIDLKTIFLQEDNYLLKEVEVQAETTSIVQKIDRKIVKVGKDLASTGTNALELMQNIPTLSTNLTTGTVSMRGNENVRVFIDGKPSNLSNSQLLKQIPSAAIKNVELITNPSAKTQS